VPLFQFVFVSFGEVERMQRILEIIELTVATKQVGVLFCKSTKKLSVVQQTHALCSLVLLCYLSPSCLNRPSIHIYIKRKKRDRIETERKKSIKCL
jgi:hypothetical protein